MLTQTSVFQLSYLVLNSFWNSFWDMMLVEIPRTDVCVTYLVLGVTPTSFCKAYNSSLR